MTFRIGDWFTSIKNEFCYFEILSVKPFRYHSYIIEDNKFFDHVYELDQNQVDNLEEHCKLLPDNILNEIKARMV
jgi:hypothetical protein